MTMANKIIKAGLAYTICNVMLRGISFLTVPLFIRLLTPEEFGKYNVFISFESILFIFSGLTIHASIKNAYYDKKDTYDKYVKNCIYLDFFNSITLLIIANILCFFYQSIIDLSFQEVNLLVVSGFCQAVVSIYSATLIMEYRSRDFITVSFISVLVGISMSLLFIFTLFDFNHYLGRVWGGLIGQLSAAIFILIKIFKHGFSKVNIASWIYGLKITLPIIPHGLSQIVLSSANRIMIKFFYSAHLAGIFSFTYTVSLVPQILFNSISNVWEPWIFEQIDKKDYSAINDGSIKFAALISFVFILMSYLVPEIIRLLATEDYYDAMDISIIVLIGCYFATLYYIPCEIEYFFKKTQYIAFSTVFCALFNVLLNYILMQSYSYKIAAYVTMVAYFLYFIFHMIMTRHICGRWVYNIFKFIQIIVMSVSLMLLSIYLIDYFALRLLFFLSTFLVSAFLYKEYIKVGWLKIAGMIKIK